MPVEDITGTLAVIIEMAPDHTSRQARKRHRVSVGREGERGKGDMCRHLQTSPLSRLPLDRMTCQVYALDPDDNGPRVQLDLSAALASGSVTGPGPGPAEGASGSAAKRLLPGQRLRVRGARRHQRQKGASSVQAGEGLPAAGPAAAIAGLAAGEVAVADLAEGVVAADLTVQQQPLSVDTLDILADGGSDASSTRGGRHLSQVSLGVPTLPYAPTMLFAIISNCGAAAGTTPSSMQNVLFTANSSFYGWNQACSFGQVIIDSHVTVQPVRKRRQMAMRHVKLSFFKLKSSFFRLGVHLRPSGPRLVHQLLHPFGRSPRPDAEAGGADGLVPSHPVHPPALPSVVHRAGNQRRAVDRDRCEGSCLLQHPGPTNV